MPQEARLDRDVLPRFGTTHIAKIDYKSVDEFIDDLKNARTSVLMLEKFYLTDLSPQMPQFVAQLRTTQTLENKGAL